MRKALEDVNGIFGDMVGAMAQVGTSAKAASSQVTVDDITVAMIHSGLAEPATYLMRNDLIEKLAFEDGCDEVTVGPWIDGFKQGARASQKREEQCRERGREVGIAEGKRLGEERRVQERKQQAEYYEDRLDEKDEYIRKLRADLKDAQADNKSLLTQVFSLREALQLPIKKVRKFRRGKRSD